MDICRHFVITLLVVHLPAILTESCDDGWQEYGDMCYYFSYNITASRDEAQDICSNKSGVLASITSSDINDYLHEQMEILSTKIGNIFHWIGLVGTHHATKKDMWHWVNGDVVTGIPWYPTEPSSEQTVCGNIGYGNWTLGNKICKTSLQYICASPTEQSHHDWVQLGKYWYFFSDSNNNFMEAMKNCFEMNSFLASFERTAVDFIRNRTSDSNSYWIGLTTLRWLDGSPISWINFQNNHYITQNNPCVYLHSQKYWESANNCHDELRFICQRGKPSITSTSTTVTTSRPTTTSSIYSSTASKRPHSSIPVSDDDDDGQVTTEVLFNGSNAITGKIGQGNKDMPMIAGSVAGIVVVIIIVALVVLLLYRRRRRANLYVDKTLTEENCSTPSPGNGDNIQPYGTSDEIDNDLQPYGTSEIQPYGTSDIKTIEDNVLNHKYESEGVSPFYDDLCVHINEKKKAMTQPDVKQQLPVYAVVNKPKDKLDSNSSKGGSEHLTQSSGKSSCDSDSLTINININNMPVYAVVDIAKKKAANTKEENAEKRSCKSADDANTPIVETNKKEILVDDVLPVYAVVDKTKKNLASVPKQFKDQQNQPEKQNINTISVPTDGPIYAVVDKNKKVQSPKPIPPAKPSAIEIQNTEIDDISTHIYSECENINNTVGYAEFDIQEGTEESNKFSIAAENDYAEVQFKD